MKRSPRPRKTISDSLHRQLNMYVLAAGAAGVGGICSPQTAQAKVVYTRANVLIPLNSTVYLDLNLDGSPDFGIRNWHSRLAYSEGLDVEVPKTQNGIVGVGASGYSQAYALPKGAKIGPKQPYRGPKLPMAATTYHYGFPSGPWLHVKEAYLGIRFLIKGQTHFGWARVRASHMTWLFPYSWTSTVTGYAYETIPGKAIVAGATKGPDESEQTASPNTTHESAILGMLALGAPGLSIWRRKESVE